MSDLFSFMKHVIQFRVFINMKRLQVSSKLELHFRMKQIFTISFFFLYDDSFDFFLYMDQCAIVAFDLESNL